MWESSMNLQYLRSSRGRGWFGWLAVAAIAMLGGACGGSSHGSAKADSQDKVNEPPQVNAGSDVSIKLDPGQVTLHATVEDDGLPNGQLSVTWTKKKGPGDVAFGDPHSPSTTATFTTTGTFVLRITADDGMAQTSDDITVAVESNDGTYESSVSEFGITWTFSEPRLVGQFATGDW